MSQKIPVSGEKDLRDCQIEAIVDFEKSFGRQHPRALVQMATGEGKMWMTVTGCYRLIKFAGAHRILSIVYRGNLGRKPYANSMAGAPVNGTIKKESVH